MKPKKRYTLDDLADQQADILAEALECGVYFIHARGLLPLPPGLFDIVRRLVARAAKRHWASIVVTLPESEANPARVGYDKFVEMVVDGGGQVCGVEYGPPWAAEERERTFRGGLLVEAGILGVAHCQTN